MNERERIWYDEAVLRHFELRVNDKTVAWAALAESETGFTVSIRETKRAASEAAIENGAAMIRHLEEHC